MTPFSHVMRWPIGLALGVVLAWPAHAQMFGGDDQARRAIIDLREQMQAQKADIEALSALRTHMLELVGQVEQMRRDMAVLRGENERLIHALGESKRATDERLRPFEPMLVSLDGLEFEARPEESQAFDEAMTALRASDFAQSVTLFGQFKSRYPQSGYTGHVLYWEGNANYAQRQYQAAVNGFNRLVEAFPQHPRTPEGLLSASSCYVELKDVRAARTALQRIVKDYPDAEAAVTASERLARLR